MSNLVRHGTHDGFVRELYSLFISDIGGLPEILLPSRHFACLVASDLMASTSEELAGFARQLVEAGAVYVCAWGPECSSLDDAVDYAAVERDLRDGREHPVIMTTWHEEDTLDEALCFLVLSARQDDAYLETCGSTLVIVVGNKEWAAQVERRLADPVRLNREVCQDSGTGRLSR